MIKQFNSLVDLMMAFPNEQAAIDHFRAIRWRDGAFCPHCNSEKVYHFSDGKSHKCGDCRKRFSIKVGTIFEDSKIPLVKWFMAIWTLTSHRNGIASTQLARDILVTQKTAWFMLHRLRSAAQTKSFNKTLSGTVEADGPYAGGKEENKHERKKLHALRGEVRKSPVLGIKQRNGEVRSGKSDGLTGSTAKDMIRKNVEAGVALITDEAPVYRCIEGGFGQFTVNHSTKEYVRDRFFHKNSIESAWALLKRQFIGICHHVSPKHLQRYLDEVRFYQNRCDVGEGFRVNQLLAATNGKQLCYKELIA